MRVTPLEQPSRKHARRAPLLRVLRINPMYFAHGTAIPLYLRAKRAPKYPFEFIYRGY